jgi:hypothetical protein
MASKEQVQTALNKLWERYGNTLTMLSDCIDKIEEKDLKIAELTRMVEAGEDIDIVLESPPELAELEKAVLNRTQRNDEK